MADNVPTFTMGTLEEMPQDAAINSIHQTLDGKRYRFDGDSWTPITSVAQSLASKSATK